MSADRTIRRYAAYFRGWAQAFGEHRILGNPAGGMRWLIGDDQIGLILEPDFKRLLYPLFLYRPGLAAPTVLLRPESIEVGAVQIPLAVAAPTPLPQVLALVTRVPELHLYQTYHLIYPSGTRILTLSARAPLPIVYRELAPIPLRIAAFPADLNDDHESAAPPSDLTSADLA
jgi:hypothetical protein